MCSRCGATAGDGYLSLEKEVKVTLFIARFKATAKVIYCPKCGLLKISLAGFHVESLD